MTEAVTPKQHKDLADLFLKLSAQSWWSAIDQDEFRAGLLVDEVIKMGWTPPMPPVPEEEWRDIPGYSYWQMSNRGQIRHKMSRVGVAISVHYDEPVTVLIHDDYGADVRVLFDELQKRTWPSPPDEETFQIVFANGNIAELPVGRLTGESTPVKFVEDLEEPDSFAEEWRPIDTIVGAESFQVSNYGRIRYKFNDRIVLPEFNADYNKHLVALKVNGRDLHIDGPSLAAVMWEK